MTDTIKQNLRIIFYRTRNMLTSTRSNNSCCNELRECFQLLLKKLSESRFDCILCECKNRKLEELQKINPMIDEFAPLKTNKLETVTVCSSVGDNRNSLNKHIPQHLSEVPGC